MQFVCHLHKDLWGPIFVNRAFYKGFIYLSPAIFQSDFVEISFQSKNIVV